MSGFLYAPDPGVASLSRGIARMSLAPNSLPPPSVNLDTDHQLSELTTRCASFLKRFDAWVLAKKKEMSDEKLAHIKIIDELKEKESQTKTQIEVYKGKESDLQRAYEKERQEAEDMEAEVTDLRIQKDERDATRDELMDRVQAMKNDIRRRREELNKKREARLNQHKRIQPELECFMNKLAMDVRGLQTDMLKFVFTHVHPQDWEKEYTFSIDVRRNDYQVVECNPAVSNLDELVEWLNKTRDFYTFLKMMRRSFVELAKIHQ
ncbi:uncharacterized protein SPPG_03673 [Spizellomyces punctatus DAOM BR117]|uniref:Kinetochore protein SPC25 n=1 Tax=Spizellomyces punctatus (strain DAOM BR117) TaxID=645134 RepID=A0A0L0HLU6_SPIPD|nr:uncharacterized protein SPPG_03673 [Spizellomyces punctatus DAOM BR117]KND01885.1 hypothetical protein SPPG_03673 [Spizellomyces punctatus DAOM BR117]|eukprot:XP_016609924.1 hypothetical protein SPPG_03673 [Spizellomyces punctatus DAOM BR117]